MSIKWIFRLSFRRFRPCSIVQGRGVASKIKIIGSQSRSGWLPIQNCPTLKLAQIQGECSSKDRLYFPPFFFIAEVKRRDGEPCLLVTWASKSLGPFGWGWPSMGLSNKSDRPISDWPNTCSPRFIAWALQLGDFLLDELRLLVDFSEAKEFGRIHGRLTFPKL